MWAATCIAALFIIAVPTATLASCADDLDALEEALFRTGNNLYQLNQNFFPPSLLPTRFVRVKYSFRDPSNNQVCNVTYIWAVGKVLFLQPPNLFKINSLFFYYPNNDLIDLPLQLPIECIHLINMTDGECTCSNDSKMLDILTQQVRGRALKSRAGACMGTCNYSEGITGGGVLFPKKKKGRL